MLQTVVNGLNKYLRKGNSLHICHCIYALLIYTSRPRFTSSNTVLICSHLFWSSTYAKALKNVKFTNEPEKKKNICSLICRDCEQDCTFLSDYNLEQKVCSIATVLQQYCNHMILSVRYQSASEQICQWSVIPLWESHFFPWVCLLKTHNYSFSNIRVIECHNTVCTSHFTTHTHMHKHTQHVDISFFLYYIEMHFIKG